MRSGQAGVQLVRARTDQLDRATAESPAYGVQLGSPATGSPVAGLRGRRTGRAGGLDLPAWTGMPQGVGFNNVETLLRQPVSTSLQPVSTPSSPSQHHRTRYEIRQLLRAAGWCLSMRLHCSCLLSPCHIHLPAPHCSFFCGRGGGRGGRLHWCPVLLILVLWHRRRPVGAWMAR